MAVANAEGLRQLVENGLQAVTAAADKGKESAGKILDAATDPALRDLLTRGTGIAATWRERADAAQHAMGKAGTEDKGVLASITHAAQQVVGASDNPIIDAIYRTGREIAVRAEDNKSRDLGILATGQLALHYYIAAFGSLASYAEALGEQQTAQTLKLCGDEAKAEDERHTDVAKRLLAS